MKKVLALVLAVIMVCTMAMAVETSGTIYAPGSTTNAEAGYDYSVTIIPGTSIFFTADELFGADKAYTETVKYNGTTYEKFVPENNKVTVTFSRGSELVSSQGWVRIQNDSYVSGAPLTKADYRYVITLKNDDTKAADTKADLAIEKIVAKATGKLAVEFKALANKHYTAVSGYNLIWNVGYTAADVTINAPAMHTDVATIALGNDIGTIYTVKATKAEDNNAVVDTAVQVVEGNGLTGKITVKAGQSYTVKNAVSTEAALIKVLKDNKLTTKDTLYAALTEDGTKVISMLAPFANEANVAVAYTLEDAQASYNVYTLAADGTITKIAANLDDGVLTFTAPAVRVVVVDGTLPVSSTAGTTTGTTTNPGTGANDVVGVAAALAVVALVSGAAISLKK